MVPSDDLILRSEFDHLQLNKLATFVHIRRALSAIVYPMAQSIVPIKADESVGFAVALTLSLAKLATKDFFTVFQIIRIENAFVMVRSRRNDFLVSNALQELNMAIRLYVEEYFQIATMPMGEISILEEGLKDALTIFSRSVIHFFV